VQVTVVIPIWNGEPEGGEQEMVAPGQLSLTVGIAHHRGGLDRTGGLSNRSLASRAGNRRLLYVIDLQQCERSVDRAACLIV
jgi:hypothetical protein